MDLLIDSRNFENIVVGLISADGAIMGTYNLEKDKAELLVDKLAEFIESNPFNPKDIKRIVVHTGPGAFVFLRTGISLALGMSTAWGVSVVGFKGEFPVNLVDLLEMELSDDLSISHS